MLSACIRFLIGIGLYGAVSVLPAVLLSPFTVNPYLICCFPFLFMNLYFTAVAKIQSMLQSAGRYDLLMHTDALYPSALKDTLFRADSGVLLFYDALTASALTVFTAAMHRRLDDAG